LGEIKEFKTSEYPSYCIGNNYVCAVNADSSLHCWGDIQVPDESDSHVSKVVCLFDQICILKIGGTVKCSKFLSGSIRESETIIPSGFETDITDIVGNTYDKVIFTRKDGSVA